MLWFVIIGFFGAFGVLCALWILLGSWLTKDGGSRVIIYPAPGHEMVAVRRFLWLRNLGLVREEVMFVSSAPSQAQDTGVEFISLEQYIVQLTEEREKLDGT